MIEGGKSGKIRKKKFRRLESMQITQENADGLKRTLQVVVGAEELNKRFSTRLNEMKGQVQLKGFRKGRVPEAHLKKIYGKSLMAEIVQQVVQESSSKAIKDRNERPAFQPDIEFPEDSDEIESVINGKSDLTYKLSFEIIPEIKLVDMSTLKLERLSVEADDEDINEALEGLAEHNVTYEAQQDRVAENGDQVTMDFIGKIDGEAFEGGSGEDIKLVLGSNSFIPGFEDGLMGVKAGDERVVDATFPDDYQAEKLAGKPAKFEVKVKEVGVALKPDISDAFAVALGVENLEKLKEMLRERISQEFNQDARYVLKRSLLDELDKKHDFELPPSLIDREFDQIWVQLEGSLKESKKTFEEEGKTEQETREEYRNIAKRRVRLGLVIAEIGEKNKIEVSPEELRNALMERARSFPGQEKMVFEFFNKNPEAIADLRGPIFEDKVVDFILELAKPTVKTVTKGNSAKRLRKSRRATARTPDHQIVRLMLKTHVKGEQRNSCADAQGTIRQSATPVFWIKRLIPA